MPAIRIHTLSFKALNYLLKLRFFHNLVYFFITNGRLLKSKRFVDHEMRRKLSIMKNNPANMTFDRKKDTDSNILIVHC